MWGSCESPPVSISPSASERERERERERSWRLGAVEGDAAHGGVGSTRIEHSREHKIHSNTRRPLGAATGNGSVRAVPTSLRLSDWTPRFGLRGMRGCERALASTALPHAYACKEARCDSDTTVIQPLFGGGPRGGWCTRQLEVVLARGFTLTHGMWGEGNKAVPRVLPRKPSRSCVSEERLPCQSGGGGRVAETVRPSPVAMRNGARRI
jgi:hypothetical protein